MSGPATPASDAVETNRIGMPVSAYKGLPSTLCKGCGHDTITTHILHAFYDYGIDPHMVAKLSGIGCSSKTTAYLLGRSHAFNGVHGRMAAVAVGVNLANRNLVNLGISGDGDTASIGLSHFLNMLRRNVRIVYIIENNGVFGLTKGQFSATADKGSTQKGSKVVNQQPAIDCCSLAIQMGCEYVARSYSGDAKQLRALIKGALAHKGAALIDVISPCISFNNHEGSTKSYKYVQTHNRPLHEIRFVPFFEPATVDKEGETVVLDMPDGSKMVLKKLERDYDPTDKAQALALLDKAREEQVIVTGLIYYGNKNKPLVEQENLVDEPLALLPDSLLRPPPRVLEELMSQLR